MDAISLWIAISKRQQHYPTLDHQLMVDVAIIGGGITGVTAALQLSQQGKKVVVLEAHVIGDGTTGHSTGNLYALVQPYYQHIRAHYNDEVVYSLIHARLRAIDYIEQVVKSYHFHCNFLRRPSYLFTNEEKSIEFLEKEIEILKNAGVNCEYVDDIQTALPFKKAAKIAQQARVNPLEYTINIAEQLAKTNVALFENTQVTSVEEKDDGYYIKTDKGSVIAKHVIMATHIPKGISVVDLLAPPYRSYAVAVKLKDKIPASGHYWLLNDPHYVISTQCSSLDQTEDDLLVIAGSHHKTGHDKDAEKNFQKLELYLRDYYPIDSVQYRWSAQHYQSADGIPYIGRVAANKNMYIATGFYADGLVYGTLAAHVITDLILGKANKLAEIVAPFRLASLSSLATLTKEGLDALSHYTKDYIIAPFEAKSVEEIPQNAARTMKINGEKCGVYRDENGKLHAVSIVCTHMKCILKWNNAEITWDCPCHGSRFTVDGQVIEGPAYSNLKKMELSEG